MKRKHALVIGGTGMLTDVSLWLADNGYVVSVIGRNKSKHENMRAKSQYPGLINSLMVDYRDHALLENLVTNAIDSYGPITLVISWTPSLGSLELINRIVCEKSQSWKLFQVMGSRRYFEENKLEVPYGCHHRRIYLGFIREGNQSRWLMNNEIAGGVIKSVEEGHSESIIGVLHPYEKRPNY
ncbi:Rossmann-fold NAD(P)-binding domain-containing protein [Halobacillus karajensis]|uniref:Short chain dehydrogenase n=1 Tax=Halobacillus karajensis TaxID=195088 RepID=A0A024P4G4_9BACI|nr:hypothetical protein [Halobacillus karajensis]CDQ20028.1 short chain dehydrogenase [Halobacillus karajensis]CDQ22487.1 short chain dehydrogenase [Halobacillus karajensis]CDQ28331.1 short chain dehydrogenase [Halobacillus karajensis]